MPNSQPITNHQSLITTKAHLSDDLLLLITCCQTNPSKDDINFIQNYLNSKCLTRNALIGLANQHGIMPLVYKTLLALYPKGTSSAFCLTANSDTPVVKTKVGCNAEILTELKAHYMSISQRNMLMSAELIRIMKLLGENGIEALAFKGPALSQMAYGDITLRQYVDLDVLVKKEDIYKIDALLKDRGYQRVIKLTANQERIWLMLKHDMGLYHPKSGVHFEMHWSLLDEDYPIQMNTSTLWENHQTVRINQQKIKTFSTEELLLYLCIHGSTHLWERIEWIKDIDLLLHTEDIDWEKSIKIAESSNVETIFYLGIYLAHILFETDLPSTISARILHDNRLSVLSVHIIQGWQKPKNAFSRTLAMLKLFPDTKARLSYLHKILLKPTLNEYDFVNLPKGMYWAYYFVRPYLLIKKYISKN